MKTLIFVMLLAAASAPGPVYAQEGEAAFATTTLDLSAEGRAEATPDLALIQVGVHAEAPNASEALAQQRHEMSAILATLRTQGLADRDIQTSALSLQPQYQDDGKTPRRLTGYQAVNSVTVRLRTVDRVGPVVDALVASGANQIDGISFGLANPGVAEAEARRAALKALQAKADLYAGATGYHIRRLVRLSEDGGASPQPMAMMAMRRMATPVAPGALSVQVGVSAVYELAR